MRTRFEKRNGAGVYEQPVCIYSVQKLNAAIELVLEKRFNRYVKRLANTATYVRMKVA